MGKVKISETFKKKLKSYSVKFLKDLNFYVKDETDPVTKYVAGNLFDIFLGVVYCATSIFLLFESKVTIHVCILSLVTALKLHIQTWIKADQDAKSNIEKMNIYIKARVKTDIERIPYQMIFDIQEDDNKNAYRFQKAMGIWGCIINTIVCLFLSFEPLVPVLLLNKLELHTIMHVISLCIISITYCIICADNLISGLSDMFQANPPSVGMNIIEKYEKFLRQRRGVQ